MRTHSTCKKRWLFIAGINRLAGTPWHVERYAREDRDDRRHRSRCIYYQKPGAYCCQIVGKCRGAAHCSYYTESQPEEYENTETETMKTSKEQKMADYEGKRLFPIGCKVRHVKYGSGTVKKVSDGKIIIDFGNDNEKTFGLDFCTKAHLLAMENE